MKKSIQSIILLSFLTLLIQACYVFKKGSWNPLPCDNKKEYNEDSSIVGKYIWSIFEVYSIMELKSNHTFKYNWQEGLSGGESVGTWELNNSKLILNSSSQPNTEEYNYLMHEEKFQSDSISILVLDTMNREIPFANCFTSKDSFIIASNTTNFDGKLTLPKHNANKIEISYIGFKKIVHPISDSISHISVKLIELPQYYEYFTNEKWIYKKDRLYSPRLKNKYSNIKYYQKYIEKD